MLLAEGDIAAGVFSNQRKRLKFDVVFATSGPLLEKTQRLRYQVYCVDLGFEDPLMYPDGREQDQYDVRAVHCLVRHRPTGIEAGSVRLVLSKANEMFPVEAVRGGYFTRMQPEDMPERRFIGEPSRLLLTSNFRRRRGEYLTPGAVGEEPAYDRRMVSVRRGSKRRHDDQGPPPERGERRDFGNDRRHNNSDRRRKLGVCAERADQCIHRDMRPKDWYAQPDRVSDERCAYPCRRIMPHVLLILIRAAVEMSHVHGVRYWYAAMEPSLLRKLKLLGLVFEPVGPPLDYGSRIRQPCRARLRELLTGVREVRPEVWDMITDSGRLEF